MKRVLLIHLHIVLLHQEGSALQTLPLSPLVKTARDGDQECSHRSHPIRELQAFMLDTEHRGVGCQFHQQEILLTHLIVMVHRRLWVWHQVLPIIRRQAAWLPVRRAPRVVQRGQDENRLLALQMKLGGEEPGIRIPTHHSQVGCRM